MGSSPLLLAPLALGLLLPWELAQAASPVPLQELEPLAELIANGDQPRLLKRVGDRLRAAADAWASGTAPDPAHSAALEAELAFAELLGPETFLWRNEFKDLNVGALTPPLAAAVAWAQQEVESLTPLTRWQVVGPFDNERGRGMTRPTPPEKDPAGAAYEGKVREVTWRTAPAPGPDGTFYLGELVDPADQVCLVARTWVHSDKAQAACLLIGATEELCVWWNGAPVYEALGNHDFGPDGHSIGVDLKAGWNELTLKVGGQDRPPLFCARLVDAVSGAALAPDSSAVAPEGVEPEALANPGRRLRESRAVPAPGGRAYFAPKADPQSVMARSALAALACARTRKDLPGYGDAKGALAAEPNSLAAAVLTLETMRVSGAIDVEEDVNPWLDLLNATIDQHGPRPRLSASYATFTQESQGLSTRALELIQEAVAAYPDSVPARMGEVRGLYAIGQVGLAERAAGTLAEDPAIRDWPDQLLELASYLPAEDPRRWELIEAGAQAGHRRARNAADERSELAAGSRDAAGFLGSLRERLGRSPYDVNLRLWGARRLLATGDHGEALGLLDEALAIAPESAGLHSWRGRALHALGDTAAAVAALEKACEYNPSSADEQRLLDFLRSRRDAGGDLAAASTPFHAPFVEPLEDIVGRHPAATEGDAGSAANAPREVLLHRQVIEVNPDGKARRYRRIVERVLSEAGVKQLDRRSFRAFRGEEDLRVLAVRILHPDGSVSEGRTGRGSRLTIDLPPLEIGDVVDIQWRKDDLRTSIFGTYFGLDAAFAPESQLATREAAITVLETPGVQLNYHLTGDPEASSPREAPETQEEDGTTVRTWTTTNLLPRRAEALEPPARERTLRLQASTYADWASFGNWWWNLIREEIAVSPEMSAKVAELTAHKETKAEKLRAIYDFVVTEIRYNAWEFGVHGYQPYSAPVIFSRRFGDCKDKAIVLRAMLGEAGIEAWPVLIQSESRRFEEDHELPLVAHFNHCIAYVPEQPGIEEMFLDGTARLHPLEVLPDSDRGARVLTVRSDGIDEMRIPFADASANERREEISVDLKDVERPTVEVVQLPTGRWDPQLRYRFAGDEAQRAEAVEAFLTQRVGAVRGAIAAQHPDYEDLTTPLRLTLEAELERVGRTVEGGLELPTSFAPHRLAQGIASESERTTDVLLDVPWSSDRTLTYRLPKDATVRRSPGAASIDTPDLRFTREMEAGVDPDGITTVTVRERLELRTHRIPVERYGAFRDAARRVDMAQRETIALEVPR